MAGSVLWVMGVLAVSTAAGYGTYVAIKEARTAAAADDIAGEPDGPRGTAPVPADPTEPPPAPAEEPVPPPDDPSAGTFPTGGDTLGSPGVAGGLDAAAVRETVTEALPRLKQCEVLLGGRVSVTLEVNRRGGVASAKAEAADEALGACAAKVLQQVRFARTTDGKPATVVVPLVFERAPAACDEVSCVLDNYTGECCAKYKRGGADTASLPDAPGRDEIVAALRPDRRNVSSCAEANNFEGTLKVKLTITPDGTVSRVSLDDVEPALTACVARVIKQHAFSKSQNGITVSFPFTVPL